MLMMMRHGLARRWAVEDGQGRFARGLVRRGHLFGGVDAAAQHLQLLGRHALFLVAVVIVHRRRLDAGDCLATCRWTPVVARLFCACRAGDKGLMHKGQSLFVVVLRGQRSLVFLVLLCLLFLLLLERRRGAFLRRQAEFSRPAQGPAWARSGIVIRMLVAVFERRGSQGLLSA